VLMWPPNASPAPTLTAPGDLIYYDSNCITFVGDPDPYFLLADLVPGRNRPGVFLQDFLRNIISVKYFHYDNFED
jgi:hypothetical protein